MPDSEFCFVLMPFGTKDDPNGGAPIDFDDIYTRSLVPAILAAGLRPHRDDAAAHGGITQKGIYEALLLCKYAIADLTIPNGNVLYELGIRHSVRPSSTLTLSARPDSIPFDVRNLRSVRYSLNKNNQLTRAGGDRLLHEVKEELIRLQKDVTANPEFSDSPLFQLIEGWRPTAPTSLKTDVFRDHVAYDDNVRDRLSRARKTAAAGRLRAAVLQTQRVRASVGHVQQAEAGVLIDLLLTYRAVERWDLMIKLVDEMPESLRERALVQEQYALAYNRMAGKRRSRSSADDDRRKAIQVLEKVVEQGRGSSETYGILGRVYKDWWRGTAARPARDHYLRQAITAYSTGFQLEPTDTFPGINATTLLFIEGGSSSTKKAKRFLPVVEFAARRLLVQQKPTYWMHATLLECAVLREDRSAAEQHLTRAAAIMDEIWQPVTTRQNLSDIATARRARGLDDNWVRLLADELGRLRPTTK